MRFINILTKISYIFILLGLYHSTSAQEKEINWTKDGTGYYKMMGGEIIAFTLPKNDAKTLVPQSLLFSSGASGLSSVKSFKVSSDGTKVLIFGNAKKVWREETRGDYWLADLTANTIRQIGKDRPASSLMFAKLSPDGSKVAYVSKHNIYVEDVIGGNSRALTTDGTDRIINGTFDWAYEEEFGCRDGFRWSPDSKSVAYWQIDARKIRNFLIINNTDSMYSYTIPVEYPKVAADPSSARIAVVDVSNAKTTWMNVPGDIVQHYIPRMDWIPNSNEIIIQQLNREQNQTNVYVCNVLNGAATSIYTETDKAWIDPIDDFTWLGTNKEFIWVSEKDGWKHYYRISRNGKKETLITKGNYDVIESALVDEKNNFLYFMASPSNATQKYLYKTKLDGNGKAEMVTPSVLSGTHSYDISPNGLFAFQTFSNASVTPISQWMNFKTGNPLTMEGSITNQLGRQVPMRSKVEFFKITTEDGIEMDGWMKKPNNFDRTKKYPVVFYVYGEPASQTVKDRWGAGHNFLYAGDMPQEGYIYIAVEGRGAPAPKGREWRKSIYKNIGTLNIRDQAMAAKKILQWPFIDKDRIAVWGWSGGGATTLNLLFQYPEIYQTGIAIAAISDQMTYDNIYQERYMGSPLKTTEAYVKGSPVTYAKNLQGNLLYIHGTADDNVHYQNAEILINELVKYRKTFQMMAYPNRTHSINEGQGTSEHLSLTYTKFLKQYCPPGGR